MTSASALLPLWNRVAEWDRRVAMVRQARAFLYLSTFYIEHDAYGIGMLTELLAAQRRGVAVNLLIDGFGQRLGGVLMSGEHRADLAARLTELRREGAVISTYHPARRMQRWLGGGQHVKIQVSEAGEAIFGSSNLSRSSYEGWNEYSVALRGPVARTLLESYRDIGGTVSESHLRQLDETSGSDLSAGAPGAKVEDPPLRTAVAGAADLMLDYWVCNPNTSQGLAGPLGWRGPNVVTDRLAARIAAAERSICITSFYFKPVEPLLAAVIAAARRGVQVEVHHSHLEALPATDLAWLAAAAHYDRLLAAGVRIYENRHGEHSKIVLIDEAWVAFGSYNFEHAAHDRLAEAMLASGDPRATHPAVEIFVALRQDPDNIMVTSTIMADWPARIRARRALFGPFKRWM